MLAIFLYGQMRGVKCVRRAVSPPTPRKRPSHRRRSMGLMLEQRVLTEEIQMSR